MNGRGTDVVPASADEAVAVQLRLRDRVVTTTPEGLAPELVVGLDVAYGASSSTVVAAAVVVDHESLAVVETATYVGTVEFPYQVGLLGFREVPALLDVVSKLWTRPDVLVVDGNGVLHPRRFGSACHVGVLTDIPTVGVAKNAICDYEKPGFDRGKWTTIQDGSGVVGRALRTQRDVKPVFVSIGHKIDLDLATRMICELAPRYRLPEPIRAADSLARRTLRELT